VRSDVIIRAGNGGRQSVVQRFLATGEQEAATLLVSPDRPAEIELLGKLALRDAEIADHKNALAVAYAEGEASGRAAAEKAFKTDWEASVQVLKEGVTSAREALARALEGFETLALLVAIEAVDKLTGNPEHYRKMLTDSIAERARELKTAGIISITVSRSDFPNVHEIAALEALLGATGEKLHVSDDLYPGECRFALTLGKADVNLNRHWDKMKTLLAGLSSESSSVS
jgi:flagellar biosynthesis/type III secretory pathway protein FliH